MAISKDSAVSPRTVIHYVGYLCGLVFWATHYQPNNDDKLLLVHPADGHY